MLEKLNTKIIENPHEIYGGAAEQEGIVTEDIVDG